MQQIISHADITPIGKEIVDLVLDRIRKLADNCSLIENHRFVRFVLFA